MNFTLTPTEARVLGSLIEKEVTTPEYYPLSLNALQNACNQKSNRDPVTNLDEAAIREALNSLNQLGLARSAATDGRVSKFEHRVNETFNFHRHELALLCVLLLRGPQTPGELRTRTERLYQFEDLDSVHSALNLLMKREPPLVEILPRQPGTKESRYSHLLSGEIHESNSHPAEFGSSVTGRISTHSSDADRISVLESEVAALRAELSDLKLQIANLRKQSQ